MFSGARRCEGRGQWQGEWRKDSSPKALGPPVFSSETVFLSKLGFELHFEEWKRRETVMVGKSEGAVLQPFLQHHPRAPMQGRSSSHLARGVEMLVFDPH